MPHDYPGTIPGIPTPYSGVYPDTYWNFLITNPYSELLKVLTSTKYYIYSEVEQICFEKRDVQGRDSFFIVSQSSKLFSMFKADKLSRLSNARMSCERRSHGLMAFAVLAQ